MAYKVVVIFEGNTEASGGSPSIGYSGKSHPYGFTEGYVTGSDSFSTEETFLRSAWAPRRAALLPRSTRITGARFYNIGGGQGVPIALNFPGGSYVTDLVNCAILAASNNTSAAVQKLWWLHNIPDSMLVGGEFEPTLSYASLVRLFLEQMAFTRWRSIVRQNLTPIVSISNAGLVTLTGASPFAVGNQVTISRTLTATGKRVGGTFMVSTIGPLSSQFTIPTWGSGASVGGQAFVKTYSLLQVGASGLPSIRRGGTRRVGRPFDLYRGRKSRRAVS